MGVSFHSIFHSTCNRSPTLHEWICVLAMQVGGTCYAECSYVVLVLVPFICPPHFPLSFTAPAVCFSIYLNRWGSTRKHHFKSACLVGRSRLQTSNKPKCSFSIEQCIPTRPSKFSSRTIYSTHPMRRKLQEQSLWKSHGAPASKRWSRQ